MYIMDESFEGRSATKTRKIAMEIANPALALAIFDGK
jgi:hypothetical protein